LIYSGAREKSLVFLSLRRNGAGQVSARKKVAQKTGSAIESANIEGHTSRTERILSLSQQTVFQFTGKYKRLRQLVWQP